MATVDSTSFDAALKDFYTDEYVRDTVSEGNVAFGMLEKDTSVTGRTYEQPIQWGIPQSRSATITDALSNKRTNKYDVFSIPTRDDFAAISISRKLMKQSGNNRGAFFEAKTREIDGMLKNLVRSISWTLFRNQGGYIARVHPSTSPSGTTITFADNQDMSFLEVDQILEASANDGSVSTDTLRSGAVSQMTITDVDEDAGTITVDALITGLTTDDFVFALGDFGNKIFGFGDWMSIRNNAATTPTSTAFAGVDRTSHITRLAGRRITATGDPVSEAIIRAASQLGKGGWPPDCCFVSFQKYEDLCIELGNKTVYDSYAVSTTVGYEGVTVRTPVGNVMVYADRNCPDAFAFLIRKADWKFIANEAIPTLHDEDGVRMLRDATADSFEVRGSYYANTACANTAGMAALTLE